MNDPSNDNKMNQDSQQSGVPKDNDTSNVAEINRSVLSNFYKKVETLVLAPVIIPSIYAITPLINIGSAVKYFMYDKNPEDKKTFNTIILDAAKTIPKVARMATADYFKNNKIYSLDSLEKVGNNKAKVNQHSKKYKRKTIIGSIPVDKRDQYKVS